MYNHSDTAGGRTRMWHVHVFRQHRVHGVCCAPSDSCVKMNIMSEVCIGACLDSCEGAPSMFEERRWGGGARPL